MTILQEQTDSSSGNSSSGNSSSAGFGSSSSADRFGESTQKDSKKEEKKELKKDPKKEELREKVQRGEGLSVKQNGVTVHVKPKTLKALYEKVGDALDPVIKLGSSSELTPKQKSVIGDRPIVRVEVAGQNAQALKELQEYELKITLPYTLKPGEEAKKVLAYRIEKDSEPIKVPSVVYDPETSEISFSAQFASTYAIGYDETHKDVEDVQTHWAKSSIEFVMARYLLKGVSERKFAPEEHVTRAMFVTVLGRASNVEDAHDAQAVFTDVAKEAYYHRFVNWAYENKITKGVSNQMFHPSGEITREQMAVMLDAYLREVLKMDDLKEIGSNSLKYSDAAQISGYAKDAVNRMGALQLMIGKQGAIFDPKAAVSRAQLATMMHRLILLQLQ